MVHMTTLYSVWHEYESTPEVDEEKLIGYYSTRERAELAIARVRDKPGFSDRPNNFNIYDEVLGMESWRTGFVRLKR
jgi:hypothetical protein